MGSSRSVQLGREEIYRSPWVNLFVDRVQLPAGKVIDRFHVLDFEKEAAAAVVSNESNEILLVQVYRYVTDSVTWEVPAGLMESEEGPIEAAQREVREEAGYVTSDARLMYSFNPENGMSNRVFHVVQCIARGEPGPIDENEIHSVHWRSPEAIREMVRAREITDGYSLTALLLHLMS